MKAKSYLHPRSSETSPALLPPLVPPPLCPSAGIPGTRYCPAPPGLSPGLPRQPGWREECWLPQQARQECPEVACLQLKLGNEYRNDPKFSDVCPDLSVQKLRVIMVTPFFRLILNIFEIANSEDPDQTAPLGAV